MQMEARQWWETLLLTLGSEDNDRRRLAESQFERARGHPQDFFVGMMSVLTGSQQFPVRL